MEELWVNDAAAPFCQADLNAITRTDAQGTLYEACYKYLDLEMKGGARSATTNRLGNDIRMDAFGNPNSESAHLLSHAEICHKAYGFVGEAAVGKSFDAQPTTDATTQIGSKRKRNPPQRYGDDPPKVKRLKILKGVKKKNGSSLKGNKFNKMYLHEQGTYYDKDDPAILLIPLLDLQDVMDWATDDSHMIDYDVMAVTFGSNSTTAARSILAAALEECTPEEIELGRQNLEAFTKGLAFSIKTKPVRESFSGEELKLSSLATWSSHVTRIKQSTFNEIGVPMALPAARNTEASFRIAKARMSLVTSLPDPWLLLLKAAINYSAFRQMKLMPACVPEKDEDPPNTSQGMEAEPRPQESFLLDSLQRGGFYPPRPYCA
ncbi:MAG: hypothetical protein SGILL_004123 [Bacillariaceae sp.]